MTDQRVPPRRREYPVIGSSLAVQRDPLGFYQHLAQQHGDLVAYTFLGRPHVFLNHPDYIKHILQEHNHNYDKQVVSYRQLTWFAGYGLLTNDGASWLQQRRLMQPIFHRKRIAALGPLIVGSTEAMLERWEATASAGTPVDMVAEMMHLTLSIVSKALFSIDLTSAAADLGHAFAEINRHYANFVATLLLPPAVPVPRNRHFRAMVAGLDSFVYGLIHDRRARPGEYDDLLSLLLEARDAETGQGMDERQIRDEVFTLLFAGHETTANALAWTWHLLSEHPAAAAQLHQELATVLGGRSPAIDDLPQLPYARMILDESLRLYPPVWFVPRRAVADDQIGSDNFTIARSSVCHFVPYVLHRHPQFWPDAEVFDPERHTPERSAARPSYAYCPFGGGPRQCIGKSFSLTESHLVLATIARKFKPRLVPDTVVRPLTQITLQPCAIGTHHLPMYLDRT